MLRSKTVPVPRVMEQFPWLKPLPHYALLWREIESECGRIKLWYIDLVDEISHDNSPSGLPSFPAVVVGAPSPAIHEVGHPLAVRKPPPGGCTVLAVPQQAPQT